MYFFIGRLRLRSAFLLNTRSSFLIRFVTSFDEHSNALSELSTFSKSSDNFFRLFFEPWVEAAFLLLMAKTMDEKDSGRLIFQKPSETRIILPLDMEVTPHSRKSRDIWKTLYDRYFNTYSMWPHARRRCIQNPRGLWPERWMNRLFICRRLLSKKNLFFRQLILKRRNPRHIFTAILSFPTSNPLALKNALDLQFLIRTRKMSDSSGENASILDNLRKSVKEQVSLTIIALICQFILPSFLSCLCVSSYHEATQNIIIENCCWCAFHYAHKWFPYSGIWTEVGVSLPAVVRTQNIIENL